MPKIPTKIVQKVITKITPPQWKARVAKEAAKMRTSVLEPKAIPPYAGGRQAGLSSQEVDSLLKSPPATEQDYGTLLSYRKPGGPDAVTDETFKQTNFLPIAQARQKYLEDPSQYYSPGVGGPDVRHIAAGETGLVNETIHLVPTKANKMVPEPIEPAKRAITQIKKKPENLPEEARLVSNPKSNVNRTLPVEALQDQVRKGYALYDEIKGSPAMDLWKKYLHQTPNPGIKRTITTVKDYISFLLIKREAMGPKAFAKFYKKEAPLLEKSLPYLENPQGGK